MEPLCHLFALSSAADGWHDLPRATDGLTVLCDFSRGVSQQARQVMQVRRDITVLGLVAPSDAATAMECIEAGARGSLLLRLGGCTRAEAIALRTRPTGSARTPRRPAWTGVALGHGHSGGAGQSPGSTRQVISGETVLRCSDVVMR
jgi:hypothetical protein